LHFLAKNLLVYARDKIKDTDMKKILILSTISVGVLSVSFLFSGCYTQLTSDRFEQSAYAEHSVASEQVADTAAVADTSGYDEEDQPDYSSWYYYYPRWNSSWYDGYAYTPSGAVIYGDGWCDSGFYSPWWGPAWYSPFYFGFGWYGHYGYGYGHGYHGYFAGGGARNFGPGRNGIMARSFGSRYNSSMRGSVSTRGFVGGNISAGRTANAVSRNSAATNVTTTARQYSPSVRQPQYKNQVNSSARSYRMGYARQNASRRNASMNSSRYRSQSNSIRSGGQRVSSHSSSSGYSRSSGGGGGRSGGGRSSGGRGR
jgi:hypothetical protein